MPSTFLYNGRAISIDAPVEILFGVGTAEEELYSKIWDAIADSEEYTPRIDLDDFALKHDELLTRVADESEQRPKSVSAKATNHLRLQRQYIFVVFLEKYPQLAGFFYNCITTVGLSISNAEILNGSQCGKDNFIEIKRVIDQQQALRWRREPDKSEAQSGISTLGNISETLLNIVFTEMIDERNFFRITNNSVQSYGDFCLICLPNNLWLSVKSNFSRERLLASGFSNDILGVGFFQEPDEFTSEVKIRNFQKAGFLAIYCPDVAVTQSQVEDNTSTYELVVKNYDDKNKQHPTNVNGRPFLRPLSSLKGDLEQLLAIDDLQLRTTVAF